MLRIEKFRAVACRVARAKYGGSEYYWRRQAYAALASTSGLSEADADAVVSRGNWPVDWRVRARYFAYVALATDTERLRLAQIVTHTIKTHGPEPC